MRNTRDDWELTKEDSGCIHLWETIYAYHFDSVKQCQWCNRTVLLTYGGQNLLKEGRAVEAKKAAARNSGLAKLTDEERDALGLQ